MISKTIGILAGMGPRSTAPFVNLVVDECQRQYQARNDADFPPMMIYSLPTPFYLDRPVDHHLMQSTILEGLHRLQATGVEFIAMPCNSAHLYIEVLQTAIQVPLLNMIEETLRLVPTTTKRAAIFATRITAESGLYHKALAGRNISITQKPDWQIQIDSLLMNIKTSPNQDHNRALWLQLLAEVRSAEVDTVVLACTDLNVVKQATDSANSHLTILDATECLARGTVERWLAVTR